MQARALQALVEPGAEDLQDVNRAWNNIIMYDEHTWGAYCSISDPFAPFTVSQEKYKKAFATEAARLTSLLEKNAAQPISQAGSGIFDVWNTSSYIRDEVVLLTPEQSARGDIIQDEFGNEVISQRLSTGELAFQAKQVPAFASRRYYNRQGRGTFQSGVRISEEEISNENISVGIQRETGAIKSIRIKSTEREVVDTAEHYLNEFIYMKGRESGKNLSGIDTPVHFSILDKGPLVATLSIESGAPGCRTLTRLIRLKSGESKIELINRVDKLKVLEPEGIYFAFPLDIPDGISRMDIPWGIVRPEADQLQGANRNYYSIQRWMDISNDHFGLTWVTRDAPMMAFSPLTIAAKGRGDSQYMAEFHKDGIRDWWKDSIRSGQSFYSWVMSNHWEVNYKAYQEGSVSFNYTLIPHEGKYDGVVAEKTARSICQPMQVVEVNGQVPVATPPFYLKSEKLVGTSLKSTPNGDAYILRLYNPSEFPGVAEIETIDGRTSGVYHCDPSGIPSDSISGKIKLEGYGLTTLRIDIPEKR
jgi:alpha-mannosidase